MSIDSEVRILEKPRLLQLPTLPRSLRVKGCDQKMFGFVTMRSAAPSAAGRTEETQSDRIARGVAYSREGDIGGLQDLFRRLPRAFKHGSGRMPGRHHRTG